MEPVPYAYIVTKSLGGDNLHTSENVRVFLDEDQADAYVTEQNDKQEAEANEDFKRFRNERPKLSPVSLSVAYSQFQKRRYFYKIEAVPLTTTK